MALPRVQKRDIVEVVFHNHHQMYKQFGCAFASAKKNGYSEIERDEAIFIIIGGNARVFGSDKTSITLAQVDDEGDCEDEIRIERKFIRSLKVVSRLTAVDLDDSLTAMIPADPKQDLEIWSGECSEHEFVPEDVRGFLKAVKTQYYAKAEKKAKKKSKKKASRTLRKGTKITAENWKPDMLVDIEAVAWHESGDNLNSTELLLVFKGKFKNTVCEFGPLRAIDPTNGRWADISSDIIKSITLAKDWTPSPSALEPEEDHDDFGNEVGGVALNWETAIFYQRGMVIGCKEFDLATIKRLYKALCKVYGEPK